MLLKMWLANKKSEVAVMSAIEKDQKRENHLFEEEILQSYSDISTNTKAWNLYLLAKQHDTSNPQVYTMPILLVLHLLFNQTEFATGAGAVGGLETPLIP